VATIFLQCPIRLLVPYFSYYVETTLLRIELGTFAFPRIGTAY